MKKIDDLRAFMVEALPELAAEPSRLQIFVDKGRLRATAAAGAGPVLAFEYVFTCTLLLIDFAGDMDALALAVLSWVADAQPELLQNFDRNRQGVSFEADILAEDKADVVIALELTDRVGASARPSGGYDIEHWPEPDLAGQDSWPDGPAEPPTITALYANGDLVATIP